MRAVLPLLPWLLILGSCGSPPKPPTVDESRKRPANTAMAVELQGCKSELQNTRILGRESDRRAETAVASAEQWLQRQSALTAPAAARQTVAATALPANSVYSVRFGFASTKVEMPAESAALLIAAAHQAPLVLLRGRTDGSTESAAESRIARLRAASVRDYLVAAGVNPARIRATYQPVGDHAADNASAAGRGQNRRVEVEVYRALPMAMDASALALPAQADATVTEAAGS
jgi:outer membrane protein OmpA-like peptidoglycan-associated protein